MTTSGEVRVGICAIAKDAGAYLEEWVVYHHLQGYRPIVVYAHECADNSHAVLARLSKFGLCEWQPFVTPATGRPQTIAYGLGLELLRSRVDWVAFLDLDEFLVTPGHSSIQGFLADHDQRRAIAVNRKTFSRAADLAGAPELVFEHCTRCAPADADANRAIRVLARIDAIQTVSAQTAQFVAGIVYETATGEAIAEHSIRSERVDHELIRVNHYARDAADDGSDTEIVRWAEPVRTLIADLRDGDLDELYEQLDAEQRRTGQLQTQVERLRAALRATTSRNDSLQAALQAEARRIEDLEREVDELHRRLGDAGQLVARIADSTSWRVGSRAVRVARRATLQSAGGQSALELAARALEERTPPPP